MVKPDTFTQMQDRIYRADWLLSLFICILTTIVDTVAIGVQLRRVLPNSSLIGLGPLLWEVAHDESALPLNFIQRIDNIKSQGCHIAAATRITYSSLREESW